MVKASDTGGADFTPAPQGTHVARCVQHIDMGTQYSEYYKKSSHKLLLGWELPNCLQDNDEPYIVWKRYTVSLHENSWLRKHLEAWRGRGFTEEELQAFEVSTVLDKPCLISVAHEKRDGRTYANVSAVMALAKGQTVPERMNNIVDFDFERFEETKGILETFSDKLREQIESTTEYKQATGYSELMEEPADDSAPEDDDIPFLWLLPWGTLMYPILRTVTNEMQTML